MPSFYITFTLKMDGSDIMLLKRLCLDAIPQKWGKELNANT
jgi:hypothetical protein